MIGGWFVGRSLLLCCFGLLYTMVNTFLVIFLVTKRYRGLEILAKVIVFLSVLIGIYAIVKGQVKFPRKNKAGKVND